MVPKGQGEVLLVEQCQENATAAVCYNCSVNKQRLNFSIHVFSSIQRYAPKNRKHLFVRNFMKSAKYWTQILKCLGCLSWQLKKGMHWYYRFPSALCEYTGNVFSPAVIFMPDMELKQTRGARKGRCPVNTIFVYKQVFFFLGRKSFYIHYTSLQFSQLRDKEFYWRRIS